MKNKDMILISRGAGSLSHRVEVFMPADRINPFEDITLSTSIDFGNSFKFNKKLDLKTVVGDLDYYVTPGQYLKWRSGIEKFILPI